MKSKIPESFSAWLSENGTKGGKRKTKAKSRAARKNVAKAREVLARKREERRVDGS